MADNENYVIRVKRGTANEWAIYNPILGAGELGYDTTNKRLKVGDGLNVWSNVKFATGNSFDVARDAGFDGTLSEWIASLKGEDGVGPTNHITVGNVTTGPEPKVELRGESPNQIIDFTFPAAGEPIEYTPATPTKDGLMPKEDKATLDGASAFGKGFLANVDATAARDNLGLSAGATSSTGVSSELNSGNQTNPRVWSPKTIADYVKAGDAAKLNEAKSYTDTAITNMPRDISKGVGSPTIPVVDKGVYIDTATGEQYVGVDKGSEILKNLATNPRFNNMTPNFATDQVSTMAPFTVVSLNLLYDHVDTPETPLNRQWNTRKSKIASYIVENNVAILGAQESGLGVPMTQIEQLCDVLPSNYAVVQVISANNGLIYDKNQVELIEYEKEYIPINKTQVNDGMERNLTVALFRHIPTDQRLIFANAHFRAGAEFDNKRMESLERVAKYLNDYRESFSDLPGVMLSGDFNKTYVGDGPDPFYIRMSELGLDASRNKAANPENTDQGSWHGFNVNGNGSKNWIDDIYSNSMMEVVSTKLDLFFADGQSMPLDPDKFLSDHHPVKTQVKFKYNMAVLSNNTVGSVTTGGGAIAYMSGRWSASGSNKECSLAVRSTTSTQSSGYPAGQETGMERLRWEPGKTYTISASVHLEETQQSWAGWARAITIGIERSDGSSAFSYATSERGANAPGTYRVFTTVTLPEDTTNCFIRLMNGTKDNQIIYWSNLLITEGSTNHPYFDGDSLGCYWEGSRHGSYSVYPGPSWVKVN